MEVAIYRLPLRVGNTMLTRGRSGFLMAAPPRPATGWTIGRDCRASAGRGGHLAKRLAVLPARPLAGSGGPTSPTRQRLPPALVPAVSGWPTAPDGWGNDCPPSRTDALARERGRARGLAGIRSTRPGALRRAGD